MQTEKHRLGDQIVSRAASRIDHDDAILVDLLDAVDDQHKLVNHRFGIGEISRHPIGGVVERVADQHVEAVRFLYQALRDDVAIGQIDLGR